LLVTSVASDSPAARAGIKAGDRLGGAEGRRLFSQTDFRGVLHRGPPNAGVIDAVWRRGDKIIEGKLNLSAGWRKTDLGWRMSISQGVIGCYPGFFPLTLNAEKRKRLGIAPDVMAIEPYMGSNTSSAAYKAGVRGNHVITAVDGVSPNLNGRAFLVWFRQAHDAGDRVTLTVRNPQGETKDISYELARSDN
jgi:serine protease Do